MAYIPAKRTATPMNLAIGLDEKTIDSIRSQLGQDMPFTLCTSCSLPDAALTDNAFPCLVWVSLPGNRELESLPADQRRHMDMLPKVIVLPEQCSTSDYEAAIDADAVEILRLPLSAKRLKGLMVRAMEAQQTRYDLQGMTREILLERELLERKNEILTFLANFLTTTSENLDLAGLLSAAQLGFSSLFSVQALHAVLWHAGDDGTINAELYIAASEGSSEHDYWRQRLMKEVPCSVCVESCSDAITVIHPIGQTPQSVAGEYITKNHVLRLPLNLGSQTLGVLLLATNMERNLGRDQVLALESALRHLTLSINGALRFRQVRNQADFDGLTRIHNRRHCELRLSAEMDRFSRYGQSFSFVIIDVDHFKSINDTYGHAVGDVVLRHIARSISESIRISDYCSRYGGEEFCVLLPCTQAEQALKLAERVRENIEATPFEVEGKTIRVTVSLGISGVCPGHGKDRDTLVREADAALYEAKAQGRNRTCINGMGTPPLSRKAV